MVMLVLSQQIDLFSSVISERVLFSPFPPLPRVNSQFSLSPQFVQLNPSPSILLTKSLSTLSQSFLLTGTATEKSLLFVAPASEANLRNEPITLFLWSVFAE